MLSVEEYRQAVLAGLSPLPAVDEPLATSLGLVLAADVTAPWPLPSFDNSSMDGYAVRAADVAAARAGAPVVLEVIDDVPAGLMPIRPVTAGTATRIMTGAPMPAGADCVVPVERTDGGTDVVAINEGVDAGAYIRRAGDDVQAGDRVVPAGTVITSRQIAVLAAVGCATVPVHRRPRVAVLATGSELVEPGTELEPGLIVDSNSFMLVSAIEEAGAIAIRVPPVVDDEELFLAAVRSQLVGAHPADLLITTGGVSMGAYDTVKAVFSQLGTVAFMKVAMNPGMPQGFGHVGTGAPGSASTPIITLPGNPVSSYVSFENFVRPAIRTLQGHRDPMRPMLRAILAEGFTSMPGKRQFMRGALDVDAAGGSVVRPVGGAGSHAVGGLAKADCLIVVPEDVVAYDSGDVVEVIDVRGQG